MNQCYSSEDQDRRELTDAEKMRIAAVRTHLAVAGDLGQVFPERLSRLRNAYQILAARRGEESQTPELERFVPDYNNARSALATSRYPGREHVPPAIRA